MVRHDPPHRPAAVERTPVAHGEGRRRPPRQERTEPKASTWNGQPLPFVASEERPLEANAERREEPQRPRRNRPEQNGVRPEPNGNRKVEAAPEPPDVDGNRWDYDSRVERDQRRQSRNGIRPIAPTLYASRSNGAPAANGADRPRREQPARSQGQQQSRSNGQPAQQSNGNGNANRRPASTVRASALRSNAPRAV